MGFFKYPYTDLNELNLDWIIAKIKYIEQAKNIIYDNSGTTLISNNVQDAINEIYNLITGQGVTSFNGRSGEVLPETGDYTAAQVTYDNTTTGYTATNVQAAIDEADAKIEAVSQTVPVTYVETFNGRSGAVTPDSGDYNGSQVTYDNTLSGLTATDLQGAVDELAAAPGGVTSFNSRTGAVVPAASDYTAAQVDFDDTVAQTGSSNVQGALQYVATRGSSAALTTYDNTQSGLTATNVQAAIDEVAQDVLSSGVASFNGRTGAVNPASGDYDLTELGDVAISTPAQDEVLKYDAVSQKWVNGAGGGGGTASSTSYDNTVSGLAATNVQDAIDEVNGDLNTLDTTVTNFNAQISGNYVLVEDHVVTNTQTTATIQNRLYQLAQDCLSFFATLANDEFCMLTGFTHGGQDGFTPTNSGIKYTNNTTYFISNFNRLVIGAATNLNSMQVASDGAAYNVYKRTAFSSSGVYSQTDFTNTTESINYYAHFSVYKLIS